MFKRVAVAVVLAVAVAAVGVVFSGPAAAEKVWSNAHIGNTSLNGYCLTLATPSSSGGLPYMAQCNTVPYQNWIYPASGNSGTIHTNNGNFCLHTNAIGHYLEAIPYSSQCKVYKMHPLAHLNPAYDRGIIGPPGGTTRLDLTIRVWGGNDTKVEEEDYTYADQRAGNNWTFRI